MTASNVERKYEVNMIGGVVAPDGRQFGYCGEATVAVLAELNTLSQRVAELEKQLSDERQASVRLRSDYDNMTKQCIKAEAERDELRKQLADLRGDRDTLAGEVRARRLPNGKTDEEHGKRWHIVQAAIDAVNASGALTRAGKDHT